MGQRAMEGSEQGRDVTTLAAVTSIDWRGQMGLVTCSRKLKPRRRWPLLETKQVEVIRPRQGLRRSQKGMTRIVRPQ